MQFNLAELLQRSHGLDYPMFLLAQDTSGINGPTLNGGPHLGWYTSLISSPTSSKVILTKHKPDLTTPCWERRGPRVRLKCSLSTQPCPVPHCHLTQASPPACPAASKQDVPTQPHVVWAPTTGLQGADRTLPPTGAGLQGADLTLPLTGKDQGVGVGGRAAQVRKKEEPACLLLLEESHPSWLCLPFLVSSLWSLPL